MLNIEIMMIAPPQQQKDSYDKIVFAPIKSPRKQSPVKNDSADLPPLCGQDMDNLNRQRIHLGIILQ